jgi:hypothetical protein
MGLMRPRRDRQGMDAKPVGERREAALRCFHRYLRAPVDPADDSSVLPHGI